MLHWKYLEALKGSPGAAAAVKDYLHGSATELKKLHLADKRGMEVCRAYTLVIDDLLAWVYAVKAGAGGASGADTALVAIGGYGRGELNIRSDVDLTLMYKGAITPAVEELNRGLLYALWDTGLDLGFSIRSIDECIALARDDLKTMTALLDRRLVAGNGRIYEELDEKVRTRLFNKAGTAGFIDGKLAENRERRQRFGGSVYTLEPNVKEGEGGLRDLHTAMWILKARSFDALAALSDVTTDDERRSLDQSLNFLLWVRNDLHFNSGRKTDQLTFDHQERMAPLLGFEAKGHALPVELFMREYYMHASHINQLSEAVLSRCLHRDRKRSFFAWPKKRVKIDMEFEITDGLLALKPGTPLKNASAHIMRAFEYCEAFDVELDRPLKDLVLNLPEEGLQSIQKSSAANDAFLKILKAERPYKTLAAMHGLGFLERYIPEFKDITCRVQHDIYHIYTVDVHSLFAVRELERLRSDYKGDFPVLSAILMDIPNAWLLVLAVLLHDIGKAHGKGHAEKGAELLPRICSRLNLSGDDADLVRFLVKNHLILADTAQYRDLHDEKLIIEFAKKIGDTERLNLLYLLTFADVRAVGPEVWSQWKGALFQELYFKATTVLDRGTFEVEEAGAKLEKIREKVIEALKPEGAERERAGEFFSLLPQRYFLNTSPDFIAAHIKIVNSLTADRPYVFSVRQDKQREYTEFIICTHDVHGLFSWITGVMAANGVDILGAQVNTLKNGICLDVLQVTNAVGELITDEHRLKKIDKDLSDVIAGRVRVAALVERRRRPSILDRKAKPKVATRVMIDNEVSDEYTVLEIRTENRLGLLYDITSTLSRLGLYIYISKITTKGLEAADIFYVKDIFGQKIFFEQRLKDAVDALYNALIGVSPETHRDKTLRP